MVEIPLFPSNPNYENSHFFTILPLFTFTLIRSNYSFLEKFWEEITNHERCFYHDTERYLAMALTTDKRGIMFEILKRK